MIKNSLHKQHMIDNHIQRTYILVFMFLASLMIVLIGLLFFQYRFFCAQAQELILLKQQYYSYIDVIQKKLNGRILINDSGDNAVSVAEVQDNDNLLDGYAMTVEEFSRAEASDDPDDDEYFDDSFVVINREPDYLKQSTVEYLQTQELNSLMTKIDMNQWTNYTEEQSITVVPERQQKALHPLVSPARQQHIVHAQKAIKDCGLSWPIDRDKFWLSSLYGPRKRINGTWGFHHGVDMAAVKGTVVKAARGGRIIEASFQSGFGNTVVVEHTSELKTRYAHLHAIRVRVGQVIKSGIIVGTVGDTGFVRKKGKDGSHLHFEVYEKGKRVNPLHCLPRF